MKKACVLGLMGVLAVSGCATTFHAGAPEGAIDVIAHRGASANAPENTLAAFKLAREMKADWFELDCMLTKDGEVIVIHDDSVDRTTNAKGQVDEMTLDELKALDAGSWKGPRFAGEQLPTLAEALDVARGKIGVYIEIKNSDEDSQLCADILETAKGHDTLTPELGDRIIGLIEADGSRNLDLTRKAIEMVRERHMAKGVVIQSFSTVVCAVARIEAPEIRVELLSGPGRDDEAGWEYALRWANMLDLAGLNTSADSLHAERVAELHANGKSVAVYTVNDRATARNLAEWGVDSLITDRPDLCLETMAELGKR